jgi:thermitase
MLVEMLKNDPEVAHAQPVYIYSIQADVVTPNDPHYPNDPVQNSNWNNLNRQQNYFEQINAPAGWTITTGSSSVTIAIVDSGVYFNHLDFAGKILTGYDFVSNNPIDASHHADDNGHGTRVAGLAAAAGNNSIGISGLNWNARILPVRVMNSNGEGTSETIAKGIIFAATNNAAVINLSLGGKGDQDEVMRKACDYAYGRGSILVAAGGNISSKSGIGADTILYPGAYENV